MESMKDWALRFADMGLAVFPLCVGKKKPATLHGVKDATRDREQIEQAWDFQQFNIGVATGDKSGGLLVIDIDYDDDSGKDGYEYLRLWEKEHGELPETVTAITGRGGMHYWYRMGGESFKNSVNEDLAIDIRANGGYVMAPPSIHPNGNTVMFENHPDDYEIAMVDENVLAFVRSVQKGVTREGGEKFELPPMIQSGGRNNTLHKYACSLQSRGMSDAEIRLLVKAANATNCEKPLPDDEVDSLVNSALGYEKGNAVRQRDLETVETDGGLAVLDQRNGKVLQTCVNATKVVMADERLTGRFLYNELSGSVMVRLPLPWDKGDGERPLVDSDFVALHTYMENNYGLTKKQNAIDSVTNVSRQNAYNPLTDWLRSLTWDGKERMDTLVVAFLGAEPTDYNIEVTRLCMFGAVARAFHPGIKFDYMPILYGRQGLGKSMFIRSLACGDEWYSDNLNTIEGDKGMEKIAGMWLVEMAELLATKRTKDVEAIKAFITSTSDYYRKPYERIATQRPRTCVFWGTTNNQSFLNDRTGNRRFLPIVCGANEPYMSVWDEGSRNYFEQAWAEAVHKYVNGKPDLKLPKHVEDIAVRQQEDFTEDDPRVGIIEDYLEQRLAVGLLEPGIKQRVCTQEIMVECLHYETTASNYMLVSRDVVAILDNMQGWKRCKGKRRTAKYGTQRCWIPIDAENVAV